MNTSKNNNSFIPVFILIIISLIMTAGSTYNVNRDYLRNKEQITSQNQLSGTIVSLWRRSSYSVITVDARSPEEDSYLKFRGSYSDFKNHKITLYRFYSPEKQRIITVRGFFIPVCAGSYLFLLCITGSLFYLILVRIKR